MARQISLLETTKIVRDRLKKVFKKTKFNVRSSKNHCYLGRITIAWNDGPTVEEVIAEINEFQSTPYSSDGAGGFTWNESTYQDEQVIWGAEAHHFERNI